MPCPILDQVPLACFRYMLCQTRDASSGTDADCTTSRNCVRTGHVCAVLRALTQSRPGGARRWVCEPAARREDRGEHRVRRLADHRRVRRQ
eukprot:2092200-Rhodomonas_salina.5